MLHIPILRRGKPYRSIDVARTVHMQTREPFVEMSLANVGLIRRDLLQQDSARAALARFKTSELIEICRKAAHSFANETLPLGETPQSPQDYVEQLSATTGLPHVLVRRNMSKVQGVLAEMESVLRGLTRNLDLSVLDSGYSVDGGQPISFFPRASTLGVVLPNNSPGVHSLWAPAIALKTALVLKPGSAEPWTPYRMIQALLKNGAPPEAFHFYPADYAGAGEILRQCGRGMVFGDASTTKQYGADPRIEVHGPGWSKVVIGEDVVDNWEKYLDSMVTSVLENSGRSCVNASGIWAPRHGREIADALAKRMAGIRPKPAADEAAQLAPFADPGVATRISKMIDDGLTESGAVDITAQYRDIARLQQFEGCTYLLPTIIRCETAEHTLANREYLFPFASVVECPQAELISRMGPSLVVTALTNDSKFKQELLASPHVGRLNFGPIPTNHITWDQPHEGNLFDHLYGRRAFQIVA
ncbi:MAG TPA: aldehyde dehydrogenase family protein [Bryobacteraceae bacterium]|nr:aldehyde dehydrogenase family protein [Bryobacteraceae bacterium]